MLHYEAAQKFGMRYIEYRGIPLTSLFGILGNSAEFSANFDGSLELWK
jgi:hypothetical protein